jgi:hypothetical protein
MRHPIEQPKYKINKQITCNWLNKGIIKGIRFIGEVKTNDYSRETFATKGWEYQIFYYKPAYKNLTGYWAEWGWISESEIDELN